MRYCVVCDAPMAGCNESPLCVECLDAGATVTNYGWFDVVVSDTNDTDKVVMKTPSGQVVVFDVDVGPMEIEQHGHTHSTHTDAVSYRAGDIDFDVREDSHYKALVIEPNDFITANNLGWCEGNIIKYICRHKRKGGADDIRKIIRYAEYILAHEYGQNGNEKVGE